MRMTLAIGNHTLNAYVFPEMDLSVHCIEELCFLIRENSAMLDDAFMDRELVRWIDQECGLRDLAEVLRPMAESDKGQLEEFAAAILEYVGLYDGETILEVRGLLRQVAGLSVMGRRKRQMDRLLERKKYVAAIRGYRALTARWEKIRTDGSELLPGREVLAGIWNNMGVAYAGMMSYGMAADCFRTAWKTDERELYFREYLAAKRLELSDSEYIALVAGLPAMGHRDAGEVSLQLEKSMERMRREWESRADTNRMKERRKLLDMDRVQNYYDDNENLLSAMKESYRRDVEG